MKLQKYHIGSRDGKCYVLYFETVKQHKHDPGMYIGFNTDSTLSTEYWTTDEYVGFSINHNNGNKTFNI